MIDTLDVVEEEIEELERELYYAEKEVASIENSLQELYYRKQDLIGFGRD